MERAPISSNIEEVALKQTQALLPSRARRAQLRFVVGQSLGRGRSAVLVSGHVGRRPAPHNLVLALIVCDSTDMPLGGMLDVNGSVCESDASGFRVALVYRLPGVDDIVGAFGYAPAKATTVKVTYEDSTSRVAVRDGVFMSVREGRVAVLGLQSDGMDSSETLRKTFRPPRSPW